jgi:hypothetical protein
MKDRDPEEVRQMRESLKQFEKIARKVSSAQAKLRESFAPPADNEYAGLSLPLPPRMSLT